MANEEREHSFVALAKRSVFSVFHSMKEKDGNHRITVKGQVWSLALLVVDAIQVLVLTLGSQYGWSSSLLGWLRDFSVLDFLLPNVDFALVYAATLVVVLLAIADAVYVANMFRHNNFKHLWALKFLRFIVGIIVTAGFVPTFGIIATPFSCSQMQQYNGAQFDCVGPTGIFFMIFSCLTLLLYIPFGLAASLVFHESDANSAHVTAKVSGREALYGTIAKLIAVVARRVSASSDADAKALAAATVCVAYAAIAVYTFRTLPFFNSLLNRFRCAISALTAYFALGAVFVSSVNVGNVEVYSVVYPLCGIIVVLVAWTLPTLRYRQLNAKLSKFRDRMITELAATHKDAPTDWLSKAGSQRTVVAGSKPHQRWARRQSINVLANRVREARFRATEMPLGEVIDDPKLLEAIETTSEQRTVFDGMAAFEVELVVRAELALPGNTDPAKRRRRFGRSTGAVPTTQAVEHAMWLFVQAIQEFCDDPVDIATVKIEYARFLQVYTADVNLATTALESAQKELPSVEGEFEVFTRLRGLQQKRQSQNLGAERNMNLIALVEYGKRLNNALAAHEKAIGSMSVLFNTIHKHKHRLSITDDAMAERLGSIIEKMSLSTTEANRAYRRLLITHPNAPHLGNIYGRFCRDVLNDIELAAQYGSHGSGGTEASGGKMSAAGGSIAGSAMSGSRKGSGLGTAYSVSNSMRAYIPRSRVGEVTFMGTQFKIGIAVLLLVATGMFATTRLVMTQTESDVAFLGVAGLQRKLTVSTAVFARSLMLEGPDPALANTTLESMAEYKRIISNVKQNGPTTAPILARWNDPTVKFKLFAGNDTFYERNVNLWDAANRLIADAHKVVEHRVDRFSAPNNTHWRLVMDNAVPAVLPGFQELLQLMEDNVFNTIAMYSQIIGTLIAVSLTTLATLGLFVFRRALKRVAIIKRGVNEISVLIPQEDLRTLRGKIANAKIYLGQARELCASAIGDGDRGMGPTSGFSYDATKGEAGRETRSDAGSGVGGSDAADSDKAAMPEVAVSDLDTDDHDPSRPESPRTALARSLHVSVDAAHSDSKIDPREASLRASSFAVRRGIAAGSPRVAALPGVVSPSGRHGAPLHTESSASAIDEGATEEADADLIVPQRHKAAKSSLGGAIMSATAATSHLAEPAASHSPLASGLDGAESAPAPRGGAGGAGAGSGSDLSRGSSSLPVVNHAVESTGVASPVLGPEEGLLDGFGSTANLLENMGALNDGEDVPAGGVGEGALLAGFGSTSDMLHALGSSADEVALSGAFANVVGTPRLGGKKATVASGATTGEEPADEALPRGVLVSAESAKPSTALERGVGVASADERKRVDDMVPTEKQIMATIPGAVVCTDERGNILLASDGFRRLLGHSTTSVRGQNIKIVQPRDIADKHDALMKRLNDGGKPRVLGLAGRQLTAIHKDGDGIPILLTLNRLVKDGQTFYIGDMQDMRTHVGLDDADSDELDSTETTQASNTNLMCRVFIALLAVALLQSGNFVFGVSSLVEVSARSAEMNNAGAMRMRTHLLAFTAREAVIGDNELWTPTQAVARLWDEITTFERVRIGLHSGDSELRLDGSARRDMLQHNLQFGTYDAEANHVKLGVGTKITHYERALHAIARDFNDDAAGVGPDPTALKMVKPLQAVLAADGGVLGGELASAVGLYSSESADRTAQILTLDLIISCVNACLVVSLYLLVFRRMMQTLLGQARRTWLLRTAQLFVLTMLSPPGTEGLLLVLPEHLAQKGPMARFFYRNTV